MKNELIQFFNYCFKVLLNTISNKFEVEESGSISNKNSDFTTLSAQLDKALSKIKEKLSEEDYTKLLNGTFSFNEEYLKFLPKKETKNIEEEEEEAREMGN